MPGDVGDQEMRRAARVDANQDAIVTALRAAGASVQPLSSVGKGCPDLLVGFSSTNWLMECKDGAKTPGNRPLTKDQSAWLKDWRGSVAVVLSPDEALRAIGALA
jgi:hypothetical protein